MFMGFTHNGKSLEAMDDFKDEIPLSSEDEYDNPDKGKLDERMVMKMNFGGGEFSKDDQDHKKSRKEVFEEIIAKSKAYKMANSEIKIAAQELSHKLDE